MADIEQIQNKEVLPQLPIKKRKIRDQNEVIIIKTFLGDIISPNDERIRFEFVDEINKDKKIMYFNDKYICDIKQVGKGAFGIVLKATHKGNKYAIKIGSRLDILYESTYIDELKQNGGSEYVINSLIPPITYENVSALVMPFYDTDLKHIINSKQSLSNAHIQCIFRNILIGLAHTHSLGIIHCDIKPANILVQGNPLKCVLTDYGISKKKGINIGDHSFTRWYRALEIIEGKQYSFSADMWGFGCILFELVTGEVLFKGGPCGDLSHNYDDDDDEVPLNIEGGVWDLINKNIETNNANKLIGLTIRIKSYDIQLLDLFKKCIEIDPEKRITAEDALKHGFLL
jgi:serine/threonine protein kinase